jgi:hypothetical protein
MTQVIDPSDKRYFTSTSDGLYDRHTYKLNVPNQGSIILEDYEVLRRVWFEKVRNYTGCTIEILDSKQNKKTNRGFK